MREFTANVDVIAMTNPRKQNHQFPSSQMKMKNFFSTTLTIGTKRIRHEVEFRRILTGKRSRTDERVIREPIPKSHFALDGSQYALLCASAISISHTFPSLNIKSTLHTPSSPSTPARALLISDRYLSR